MAKKIDTALVHAGRNGTKSYGYVNPKLVRGSTVLYPDMATKLAIGQRRREPVDIYGTHGNETHFALQAAVAEIEGGTHCQVVGSGLAAVTVPLLAYLRAGDHMLVPDSVYGPTRNFCDGTLTRYGVSTEYYDPMISAADLRPRLRPNTRILFTESPGSHTFEVQDIPMLARLAHEAGAKLFMDNTWGVLNFQPFAHGVDVSIQALTKYVGGHSDLILGAVTVNSDEDWAWLRDGALQMGAYASPDDCWLALRGLRTLAGAAESPGSSRAARGKMVRRTAGSGARAASGFARLPRPRNFQARFHRRLQPVRRGVPAAIFRRRGGGDDRCAATVRHRRQLGRV